MKIASHLMFRLRNEKCKRQFSRGITSSEILVSVAIISLIAVVILSILITLQVAWSNGAIDVRLQHEAKQPMQAIIKELKEADPNSPIGITISPDQRTITFAVPQTVGTDAITAWTQVSFSFDASTGNITRTSSKTSTVGRQISNLIFSRTADMITVSLTATGSTADGKILTASLTSQAAMRK